MNVGRVTFGPLCPETPGTFRNVNDDAQLIAALTAKVQSLEGQNAKLVELLEGIQQIGGLTNLALIRIREVLAEAKGKP